jgi:hypothetical protein
VANRPKKNRSARDKQLARERARRAARNRKYPLYDHRPPFEPYSEWIHVPAGAEQLIEHPARYDERLPDDAKDMADTLVKLGPRYEGYVPLAALYLEDQISHGAVKIATTGRPGVSQTVPIAEIAAQVSDPDELRRMQEEYPEGDLPGEAQLMTDDAAALHIHWLHAKGMLVMDDDHILNLAMAPALPGGKWKLNGHNWD